MLGGAKHAGALAMPALLAVVAGGCAGHATPGPILNGVISGVAAHCAGPPGAALLPVRVSASQHGQAVATVGVSYRADRDHFRLSLPPGRYLISARESGDAPRVVLMRSGGHVTANFPDVCY